MVSQEVCAFLAVEVEKVSHQIDVMAEDAIHALDSLQSG